MHLLLVCLPQKMPVLFHVVVELCSVTIADRQVLVFVAHVYKRLHQQLSAVQCLLCADVS